jgi:hypothetical protein
MAGCAQGRGCGRCCSRTDLTHPQQNSNPRLDSGSTLSQAPQKSCPVTGEKLGSMEKPIPVSANGKTILVCCQGCVAEVKQEPEKYLAIVAAEQ